MKVREAMTPNVRIAAPHQTIREAACMMADIDAGALPVGENDRLIGVITDRDIAIRAVGQGLSHQTPIREVMSTEVLYCYEDEYLDDLAKNMSNVKVRRLLVLDRDKRLVGIVSLGDLAVHDASRTTARTVANISQPGGAHSQGAH